MRRVFGDLVIPHEPVGHVVGAPDSNEMIRRDNLRRVLSLLHYRGGHRRVDIALRTGLTRSTVGTLVLELAQRGLVTEHVRETGQRGRPSPEVVADGERVCALAVNTESAWVSVALVGLGGRIHEVVVADRDPTADARATCEQIAHLARGLQQDAVRRRRTVVGVGVAVPGQVRVSDGVVRHAPHLGWYEAPVAALLTERLGLPTVVGNDASVILGASALFGDGLGEDLVYLAGRPSGVGGAIVSLGRLVHGASGYAGEWGHVPVTRPGTPCVCGGSGCLETEVSLERLLAASGLAESDAERLPLLLRERSVDALEREAARQLGHLEVAVRTIVNSLNPRTVLLGGFLGDLWDSRTAPEQHGLLSHALSAAAEGVVVRSSHGDAEAVLLGAAELALVPVLRAPDLVATVTV